jgi:hypothetical protein
MAYAHAERNLALLRQLEAETRQLPESLDQPDPDSQPGCRRSPPLASNVSSLNVTPSWSLLNRKGSSRGNYRRLMA